MIKKERRNLACVRSTLCEIGQAIHTCEIETAVLENSILSWIQSTDHLSAPIEDLQRIDYLRQMLNDLSTAVIFISRNGIGLDDAEKTYFEVSKLLEHLTLGEVKDRLLRSSSIQQNITTNQSPTIHQSSDVQLFVE